MKSYLVAAIQSLKPGSEFELSNDDYSTIQWHVIDGDTPTQKQIDDEIKSLKALEAQELATAEEQKAAILAKLGITADELKVAIG